MQLAGEWLWAWPPIGPAVHDQACYQQTLPGIPGRRHTMSISSRFLRFSIPKTWLDECCLGFFFVFLCGNLWCLLPDRIFGSLRKAASLSYWKQTSSVGCTGCLLTLGLVLLSVLSLTQVCRCGRIEYTVPTASWGCISSCSTQSHCKCLPCTAQCGGKWGLQEEGEAHAVLCSGIMQRGLFVGNMRYVPNVIIAIQNKGLLWYSHLWFNVWLLWKLRNAILSTIRGHLWIISFSRCARRNAKELLITIYVSNKVSWEYVRGLEAHGICLMSSFVCMGWSLESCSNSLGGERVSHSFTGALHIPTQEENGCHHSSCLPHPWLFWAEQICVSWE